MKKLITLMLSLVLMMTLSACSSSKSNNDSSNTAVITVENYGKITVQLDPKQAPITVKNFKDPNGDGTGGSDDTIKGEFSANGVKNTLKHKRGVISMARSSDYNSASSQFFIMQETNSSLDGQYAAFGKVTSGMDVVDKIANSVQVTDNNGSVAAKNQPVITSIRMKK